MKDSELDFLTVCATVVSVSYQQRTDISEIQRGPEIVINKKKPSIRMLKNWLKLFTKLCYWTSWKNANSIYTQQINSNQTQSCFIFHFDKPFIIFNRESYSIIKSLQLQANYDQYITFKSCALKSSNESQIVYKK